MERWRERSALRGEKEEPDGSKEEEGAKRRDGDEGVTQPVEEEEELV